MEISSLENVLADPAASNAFKTHLSARLETNNLLFWVEVEAYKDTLERNSHALFNNYIREDAPCMVDLTPAERRLIHIKVENDADSDLFSAAENKVYDKLQEGYRTFLESVHCASYLESMKYSREKDIVVADVAEVVMDVADIDAEVKEEHEEEESRGERVTENRSEQTEEEEVEALMKRTSEKFKHLAKKALRKSFNAASRDQPSSG